MSKTKIVNKNKNDRQESLNYNDQLLLNAVKKTLNSIKDQTDELFFDDIMAKVMIYEGKDRKSNKSIDQEFVLLDEIAPIIRRLIKVRRYHLTLINKLTKLNKK